MTSCTQADWKRLAAESESTGTSVLWSHDAGRYLKPDAADFLAEPSDAPDGWQFSDVRLNVLRHQAWRAQSISSESAWNERINAARVWLKFLLELSHRSLFVQERLPDDKRFFRPVEPDGYGTCLPRQPRPAVTAKGFDPDHLVWCDMLPWCDSENLTPVELEVALVLFDWTSPAPRFAPWVYRSPDILRAVERFLLARYCWPLVEALQQARHWPEFPQQDRFQLRRVPNQVTQRFDRRWMSAGLSVRWIRMAGLSVVGLFALTGWNAMQALLFAAPWAWVTFWGLAMTSAAWYVARIDVDKQCHGQLPPRLLNGRAHMLCWWMCRVSVSCSLAFAFLRVVPLGACELPWWLGEWNSAALWSPGGQSHPLTNVVAPAWPAGVRGWLRWGWGVIGQGLTATLVGSLLQWFWEDKAATEPI